MSDKIYLDWSNPTVYWSGGQTDYVWSEVYILNEVGEAAGVGGGFIMDRREPWEWLENKVDPKVAEGFKKIVIRVNGLQKTKKGKEPKVTATHVRKTFKHFGMGVKVIVKDSTHGEQINTRPKVTVTLPKEDQDSDI